MKMANGDFKFNGKDKWIPEKNKESQKYMLNAYRVLFTRACQGMIICIPEGNKKTTDEGFPEDPIQHVYRNIMIPLIITLNQLE